MAAALYVQFSGMFMLAKCRSCMYCICQKNNETTVIPRCDFIPHHRELLLGWRCDLLPPSSNSGDPVLHRNFKTSTELQLHRQRHTTTTFSSMKTAATSSLRALKGSCSQGRKWLVQGEGTDLVAVRSLSTSASCSTARHSPQLGDRREPKFQQRPDEQGQDAWLRNMREVRDFRRKQEGLSEWLNGTAADSENSKCRCISHLESREQHRKTHPCHQRRHHCRHYLHPELHWDTQRISLCLHSHHTSMETDQD